MTDRKQSRIVVLVLMTSLALPVTRAIADTDVTAANNSGDSDVQSGDAHASNSDAAQVGPQGGGSSQVGSSDINSNQSTNVQEGDNSFDADQTAMSQSGDTVGGQVIGAVVPNGSLDVDAANANEGVDLESGDATSDNDVAAFVGLSNASETSVGASDINSGNATNVQEGDNSSDATQVADAVTGDAVGGQVFGAVTGGVTDVVLANTSKDTDASTGDSDETNDSDLLTGLSASGIVEV
jgi:hypothetical protein